MIRILLSMIVLACVCVTCTNRPHAADRQSVDAEVVRLRSIVDHGGGNAAVGKAVFTARCGRCHQLNGAGGAVGPDLTPYLRDREHIDFILESIVRPEAMVHEYHPTVVVYTVGGGFHVGTVISMDANSVVLALPGGDQIVLPQSKVQSVQDRPQSLMPDQTLRGLTDAQVRDLFAYIMSQ